MAEEWIIQKPEGVLIRVKLKPRSGRDSIEGVKQDRLVVKVSAPPADNKANQALIAFLARKLKIPASDLQIKAGAKSRNKTVLVPGAEKKRVEKDLDSN
ncbi:MAG: DUF167 domain-containing protein [bacterium]